jgi:Mg/Co/Ni transporter MgtE
LQPCARDFRHKLLTRTPEYRAAIRRAHLVGLAGGLVLAFVCLVIGIALYDAINTNWPVACDGTAALPSCAARIIGALT